MPEITFSHAMDRILGAVARPTVLLAALSGGMDSVVLLHLLKTRLEAERRPGIRIVAAHLNHGLRGPEADEDEAFCRRYAADLGLAFAARRVDAAAYGRPAGLGIEAADRELRYRFFAEECGGAGLTLTGHHADDQVETILLHLRRGAHRRGLAGMAELSLLDTGSAMQFRLQVGRPLLGADRPALERYAREHGLSWREDRSNRDPAFLRNRIRIRIVPFLESHMPDFRRSLLLRAARAAGEERAWEERSRIHLAALARREYGGSFLSLVGFPADREEATYLLRRAVEEESGRRVRDRAGLERLRRLAMTAEPGGSLVLAGGLLARREEDGVFFIMPGGFPPAQPLVLPRPPFAVDAAGMRVTAEWRATDGLPPGEDMADPEVQWFDFSRLRPPLVLRPPFPGERFRPLGAPGRRKIQDMLVDGKVPRRARGAARVLADGDGALWLWPLRTAHRARLAGPSGKALRITMRPIRQGAGSEGGREGGDRER